MKIFAINIGVGLLILLNSNLAVVAAPQVSQKTESSDKVLTKVKFLKPVTDDKRETGKKTKPSFEPITEREQLMALKQNLKNESAYFAFKLFDMAQRTAGTKYPFFIVIEKGGNNASQGFRLRVAADQYENFDRAPYIKLDPSAKAFRTTLLHESGHMIFSVLSRGQGIATEQIAPMYHTTSAITDRGTAFNEGFAEHLEAVMAHFSGDRQTKQYYGHRKLANPSGSMVRSGFLFPMDDMSNYAQSFARYQSVRDNHYSFENATDTINYYRIQLSPTPDLERPRNASQLVASEGFCATYFFWLVAEQIDTLSPEEITEVYQPIFDALQLTLAKVPKDNEPIPPYLTSFVKNYGQKNSKLKTVGVRLLHHLSHGAFFDRDYSNRWKEALRAHYRLDIAAIRKLHQSLESNEKKIVEQFSKRHESIDSNIGNVIAVQLANTKVRLPVAFGGQELPLSFDINTIPARVLTMIDGISQKEIDSFEVNRKVPYRDLADFKKRSGIKKQILEQFKPINLER